MRPEHSGKTHSNMEYPMQWDLTVVLELLQDTLEYAHNAKIIFAGIRTRAACVAGTDPNHRTTASCPLSVRIAFINHWDNSKMSLGVPPRLYIEGDQSIWPPSNKRGSDPRM